MPQTMRAAEMAVIRKPPTYAEGRVCGAEGCRVRLSRYNGSDRCYAHTPRHVPRLRGEFSETWVARH